MGNRQYFSSPCVTMQYIVLGDSISTVECYDAIVGRWQITEAMTTLRSRVGVTVLKGKFTTFF